MKREIKSGRNEIRIVDIPDKLYASIKLKSEASDRTINKQVLNDLKRIYKFK